MLQWYYLWILFFDVDHLNFYSGHLKLVVTGPDGHQLSKLNDAAGHYHCFLYNSVFRRTTLDCWNTATHYTDVNNWRGLRWEGKTCPSIMTYSHCRIRTRTRITVPCRNFPLVQIQNLIPWLKCSKSEMEICSWEGDLSLKWVQ